jgi:hypothetical protein
MIQASARRSTPNLSAKVGNKMETRDFSKLLMGIVRGTPKLPLNIPKFTTSSNEYTILKILHLFSNTCKGTEATLTADRCGLQSLRSYGGREVKPFNGTVSWWVAASV